MPAQPGSRQVKWATPDPSPFPLSPQWRSRRATWKLPWRKTSTGGWWRRAPWKPEPLKMPLPCSGRQPCPAGLGAQQVLRGAPRDVCGRVTLTAWPTAPSQAEQDGRALVPLVPPAHKANAALPRGALDTGTWEGDSGLGAGLMGLHVISCLAILPWASGVAAPPYSCQGHNPLLAPCTLSSSL